MCASSLKIRVMALLLWQMDEKVWCCVGYSPKPIATVSFLISARRLQSVILALRFLLLRLATVSCASLFLLLLAVYMCSFKQDWSHACGSYRCVQIEFSGTIWAVNWLASEGLLLTNRYAKHAAASVSARNHQTSWTFVPAVHHLFDSRGKGTRAECLHATVQSAFIP